MNALSVKKNGVKGDEKIEVSSKDAKDAGKDGPVDNDKAPTKDTKAVDKGLEEDDKTKRLMRKITCNYKVPSFEQDNENDEVNIENMMTRSLSPGYGPGVGSEKTNGSSKEDEALFNYLGLEEVYGEDLELLAKMRSGLLEELNLLESIIRMGGMYPTRDLINVWFRVKSRPFLRQVICLN